MAWSSEGKKTDPVAGTLLADTGGLPAMSLGSNLIVWSNVFVRLIIAVRNALNTADVASQTVECTGNFIVVGIPITLVLNQRLIIRTDNDITGDVQRQHHLLRR